jgi:outer membrane scaffolding protein for murein synthesis (MipA/OmpV family)
MKRLAILAGLGAMGAAGHAAAQEAAPEAAWVVDAGAAARLRPDHIGSSHYRLDAVPIVEATVGDRLVISLDDGVKYRLAQWGPFAAGALAEYRQSFNDNLPAGAFRMSDVVEVGGYGQVRTPIGIAEFRLRHALGGYDGWSGDLSFDTGAPVTPKLLVGGQARISWADSNFTQEYFGLRRHAPTRFGLPRFLDEDFVTAGLDLDAAYQLTPRTRAVLEVSADRIVGELRPSPIFDSRNIFTASLGFTYHWSARTPLSKSSGRLP